MICRLQKAGGCRSRDNHREENIMDRAEKALEVKHQMGINCCQAVLLAYKDELNKTEEELLRLGSGFGGGMGCMEGSCGALIGAVMVLSADLSFLPTIILRRFLFTNDPAYLLLSVALGDVFFIAPTFALRYPVHVA